MLQGEQAPRTLIVFLTYGDAYKGSLGDFLRICRRIRLPKRLLIVRNDADAGLSVQIDDWIFELGGDNSVFEFSGWQKALESQAAREFDPDVYLIANDAFRARGFSTVPAIDDEILGTVSRQRLFGGHRRRFSFHASCRGMDLSPYVSASFFVASKEVLQDIGELVTERSCEKFVKQPFEQDLFTDDEMWSARLKKYVTVGLTRNYHEPGKRLRPEHHDFFQRKILCIVNELLLSARVRSKGYRIVDLTPFPCLFNSFFTIFTPWTTLAPFQFLRKRAFSILHAVFYNAASTRAGLNEWFDRARVRSVKRNLSRPSG